MQEAQLCTVDWQLAPFIRGFTEEAFGQEIQAFVSKHAAEFATPCLDGSYPLAWTQLHYQYSKLFECQLQSIVQEEGFSRDDFRNHMLELREAACTLQEDEFLPGCEPSYIPPGPGIRVRDFWSFLEALTASEDFDRFLLVMFKAASIKKAEPSVAGYVQVEVPEAPVACREQEIDVTVPEGTVPGQFVAVDFLGSRYELEVPVGCPAGSVFRASIMS